MNSIAADEKYILDKLRLFFNNKKVSSDLAKIIENDDDFLELNIEYSELDILDKCELVYYIEQNFKVKIRDDENLTNIKELVERIK